MDINDIKKVIESLLFVSDKPLLNREIRAVIKNELPENIKIEDIMSELQQEYENLDRSFELKFVADGWTFATKPQYSPWIKILLKEKTILKLSPSAMEVLAIIAYKQPITRAEIDNVRGVDSGGVIDTLTDRKFIKIVGRKETLGRPLLYGTTQEFLRHFGLSHLSELPVIESEKDVLADKKESVQELPFDNNGSEGKQQNLEQSNEDKQNVSETDILKNESSENSEIKSESTEVGNTVETVDKSDEQKTDNDSVADTENVQQNDNSTEK